MNPSLIDKAIIFLGLITLVALAGAIYLMSQSVDATAAWALAGTGLGAISGILVPTRTPGV